MNKNLFKASAIENNYTVESLALEIGLNPATLYRKLAGKSEFTRAEIQNLRRILRLTSERADEIFFAD